jgi:hypothetical protein
MPLVEMLASLEKMITYMAIVISGWRKNQMGPKMVCL